MLLSDRCSTGFRLSTTHRAVSAGDNGVYLFIPFFIIQLIHLRVQETRLLRHQLPNSLPITNKQRRRGSDVERPTVKVVAQAVSSGLLVGSAVCRSCGLAHGEMYVFNLSHSTFSSQETPHVGRRSRRHVARACSPPWLSHSRMLCARECKAHIQTESLTFIDRICWFL